MQAKRRRPREEAQAAAPVPFNAQPVLDLGNLVYFLFRGRAYGVPPLGWRDGQRLHGIWTEARDLGELTAENTATYYGLIAQLPRLIRRLSFPCGKLRRLASRLRLIRNPFEQATERELVELAGLFLGRRLTSTIGTQPAMDLDGQPITSTSSPRFAMASRRGSTNGASR